MKDREDLAKRLRRIASEIEQTADDVDSQAAALTPSLGKCFECDGELSVWCPACNGNAEKDWLDALPVQPTESLRRAYQFYLDKFNPQSRDAIADVPAGASEDATRPIVYDPAKTIAQRIIARHPQRDGTDPSEEAVLATAYLRRLSPTADLPVPNEETLHDEVSEIIAGYVTIEEYFEGDHRKRRITDCGPATDAVLKHLKSYGLLHTADLIAAAEGGAAIRDVIAERQRQISQEGWTPEHDDEHTKGEMAKAAGCYALNLTEVRIHDAVRVGRPANEPVIVKLWPWDREWWKPQDKRRNLVKAGALILAEIERLDRAAIRSAEGGEG